MMGANVMKSEELHQIHQAKERAHRVNQKKEKAAKHATSARNRNSSVAPMSPLRKVDEKQGGKNKVSLVPLVSAPSFGEALIMNSPSDKDHVEDYDADTSKSKTFAPLGWTAFIALSMKNKKERSFLENQTWAFIRQPKKRFLDVSQAAFYCTIFRIKFLILTP